MIILFESYFLSYGLKCILVIKFVAKCTVQKGLNK